MSDSLTLDDLLNMQDDLEVTHDDDAANTGIPNLAPIPAGKYGVTLTTIDYDRDQAGQKKSEHDFKADFKIVEAARGPEWAVDRALRFIRQSGKSKKRWVNQVQRDYVELIDLAKGFDRTFRAENSLKKTLTFLLEKSAESAVAHIQLDWKAFDSKYFEQMNGDTLEDGSLAKKELFKACAIRGMKKFESDGTYLSPASGNVLKANPYIRWVYVAAEQD